MIQIKVIRILNKKAKYRNLLFSNHCLETTSSNGIKRLMIVFKVIYDMIGNKFRGCSMIKTHFKYLLINTKHVHVFVVVMQNQIKYGDRTYILQQFIEAT